MTPARAAGSIVRLAMLASVATGCAAAWVVAVPAGGVVLDAARGSATVGAEGVLLIVRPSAWRGSPAYLPAYVTPFHLELVNETAVPLAYDYPDLRLFDEARFQYTALPPAEVGRILRGSGPAGGALAASASAAPAPLHRRWPVWDPWGWDPWWGWPPAYAPPPRLDEVFLQALPVGPLQAGARIGGFAYFPRLRSDATQLTFEFHYRRGDAPRVLTLPFAVRRGARDGEPPRLRAVLPPDWGGAPPVHPRGGYPPPDPPARSRLPRVAACLVDPTGLGPSQLRAAP